MPKDWDFQSAGGRVCWGDERPQVHVVDETIVYLGSLVEGSALERDTVEVAMTQAEEAAKAQGRQM